MQTPIRCYLMRGGSSKGLYFRREDLPADEALRERVLVAAMGSDAPIVCNYLDVAGSATGSLLPTGRALDVVDGIELTCIDNGMPVVVLRARDLDVTGYETPQDLEKNKELKARIESIRLKIGP